MLTQVKKLAHHFVFIARFRENFGTIGQNIRFLSGMRSGHGNVAKLIGKWKYRHPVYIRAGTSDLYVFKQVMI